MSESYPIPREHGGCVGVSTSQECMETILAEAVCGPRRPEPRCIAPKTKLSPCLGGERNRVRALGCRARKCR